MTMKAWVIAIITAGLSAFEMFWTGLSEAQLKAITALAQAIATVLSALIIGIAGALITSFFNRRRDQEQRESWWRGHALELTKLDLERKLRTRNPQTAQPIRPSILDFLANYRDLQQLGNANPPPRLDPPELYEKIRSERISAPDEVPSSSISWRKGMLDMIAEHPEHRAEIVDLWAKLFPEDNEWLQAIREEENPSPASLPPWLRFLGYLAAVAAASMVWRLVIRQDRQRS